MVRLSEAQWSAVVSILRLLRNTRVRALGAEVTAALQTDGVMLAGKYVLQELIEARLRPRTAEVRELRDELVPAPMREVWGLRHPWALTLDSENLQLMQGR